MEIIARNFTLTGRVQGVGFRPFVYRLAHEHGIQGWVRNAVGRVEIHAEGPAEELASFRHGLIAQAPPQALPKIEFEDDADLENSNGFYIVRSDAGGDAEAAEATAERTAGGAAGVTVGAARAWRQRRRAWKRSEMDADAEMETCAGIAAAGLLPKMDLLGLQHRVLIVGRPDPPPRRGLDCSER